MSGNRANTAEKLEKLGKCYVLFRPHSAWKGEYGFDWIRFKQYKDSTVNGEKGNDFDTKNILGIYSSTCNKTGCDYRTQCQLSGKNVCIDINSWSSTFSKDVNNNETQYKNLCGKFTVKQIKGWDDITYFDTPIMTILSSEKSVKIKLKVVIKDAPIDGLFWDYDKKIFKLDFPQSIDTKKEGVQDIEFNLTCNQSFATNQTIAVYCDKEKTKLCGSLKILANYESFQRKIDAILVKVKLDIGNGSSTGNFNGGLSEVTNILKQAYVTLNDNSDAVKLLNIPNFNQNYILDDGELSVKLDGNLLTYLNGIVNGLDNKYTNYFKVYAIAEKCNAGKTLGFSVPGTDSCVVFSGHNNSTVPHELLHSLKLPHTFVAKDTDSNAKYTYEALITDNLMDYSHWNNLQRISTFYWQWQIMNDKIK